MGHGVENDPNNGKLDWKEVLEMPPERWHQLVDLTKEAEAFFKAHSIPIPNVEVDQYLPLVTIGDAPRPEAKEVPKVIDPVELQKTAEKIVWSLQNNGTVEALIQPYASDKENLGSLARALKDAQDRTWPHRYEFSYDEGVLSISPYRQGLSYANDRSLVVTARDDWRPERWVK